MVDGRKQWRNWERCIEKRAKKERLAPIDTLLPSVVIDSIAIIFPSALALRHLLYTIQTDTRVRASLFVLSFPCTRWQPAVLLYTAALSYLTLLLLHPPENDNNNNNNKTLIWKKKKTRRWALLSCAQSAVLERKQHGGIHSSAYKEDYSGDCLASILYFTHYESLNK